MHTQSSTRKLSVLTRTAVLMITLLILASLVVTTVLAAATGASSPTQASTTGKGWSNISYSFGSDNSYAVAKKNNKTLRLSNFNLPGIPGNSTINGIQVTVEGMTTGMQASVALSFDNGTTYTSGLLTALTGTDAVYTLGGPAITWGRTWNASEFTNDKFVVKLTSTGGLPASGNTLSVDQVLVTVYYTPASTTLTLDPVSGLYNATANMTATLKLTSDSSAIVGKAISFYINGTGIDVNGSCTGTYVGDATTQDGGVATFVDADLSGIVAGTYPYGACASFAGDLGLQATSITNSLTVIGNDTTLTASSATGTYGGTVNLSATLTSNNSPVNNQYIAFYLFGNELGSAKTGPTGVATLQNVSLIGYDAGVSNDIGAVFGGDGNLNPSNATAQITINQRPITVTAVTSSKVYDGTTSSSGTPNLSANALVTGDTANFIQTFATKDVGTGKTINPSGAVEDGNSGLNYAVTFVSVSTGTISKASVAVTADDQSKDVKPVLAPDPAFTFHYTSLLGSDTGADIDVPPTCTVSGAHNIIGTYTITCSGASDNNYNFTYVSGTLTIKKARLGGDTVGVFRPSNGLLYLKNTNVSGYADIAINYGMGGDYPIAGDWDGDGIESIGIYRNGKFYLRNSNTVGYADIEFAFGSAGDQPVVGDWNGDGIDTIGVYRSSTFTFYLRNSNTAGYADMTFSLGIPGDIGITGDWDGDGKDTTGVFRPSNGVIFLKNTNVTGYADIAINYGIGGDKPVTGDWNNDGVDTIGVLRGNIFYLRNSNTIGYADIDFALGIPGDMPIAGNWDGLP